MQQGAAGERVGPTLSEDTIFRTIDLPPGGPDYRWFADLNVVGLRRGLDCAGKLRAIAELQEWWRTNHLHLVESA